MPIPLKVLQLKTSKFMKFQLGYMLVITIHEESKLVKRKTLVY